MLSDFAEKKETCFDHKKRNVSKSKKSAFPKGLTHAFGQNNFNMWTVSSDVSLQRRHWQPLSVHLCAYSTRPTHDVNDVMCEGWPQHRGLRPLLFSNSGVGSFMSLHAQEL